MLHRALWTKTCMFRDRMRGCMTFSSMETKAAIVGIDLGCKNSRVAIVDSLVPRVLESEIGRFTPSYVTLMLLNSGIPYAWGLQHLDRVGRRVAVGELAKRQMSRQPSDVVFNVKKLVGRQLDDPDVQQMMKRSNLTLLKDQKENPGSKHKD